MGDGDRGGWDALAGDEEDDDDNDGAPDGTVSFFLLIVMMVLLLAAGARGTRGAGIGAAAGEEEAEEGREVPSLTMAA